MAPLLRGLILVLVGTVFIAICAHIKVPMWPVPMTMQTFAVLAIGMAYGWRLGGATILLYLAEGAVGLPDEGVKVIAVIEAAVFPVTFD